MYASFSSFARMPEACFSRSAINFERRAFSAPASTASTSPSSSTSLPSNGIATAVAGRAAGLAPTDSSPAIVSTTPPDDAINARTDSPARSAMRRFGETCRSPRTLRIASTSAWTRANSASAFSSCKFAANRGHAAVAQSALG